LLMVVLGVLAWGAGSAAGAPVLLARFNGSGIGASLSHPTGLAIDQSGAAVAGNLLLADGGESNVVDLFGPEGGLPAGGVPTQLSHAFAFGGEPAGVAVDSSGGASNGDLYVADVQNRIVDKFALNGSSYEYVCQITGYGSGCHVEGQPALQAFTEPTGIAVDAHGNLYVSDYGNEVVDEFSEAGANVRQIKGSVIALEHPSGLAFDSQGDLYVQQYRGGRVLRFGANLLGEIEPEATPTVLDAGPAYGVAVNAHTGEAYVAHGSAVAQYSPSGAPEGEFGSGSLGETSGIAVNATTGNVYVADAGHDNISMFGIAPAQPPLIGASEYTRDVAATSALLTAHVNARYFDTHCYVEYGTDTGYSAGSSPAQPGLDIGSGGGPEGERTVEVLLHGLSPGVTYHYRIVAVNSNGEASHGPDREFTTFLTGPFTLPDGRAWEMVSPPEKSNSDILGIDGSSGGGVVQAAAEGDTITFVSHGAFSGSKSNGTGDQYVASRARGGWSTQSIDPPMNAQTYNSGGVGTSYRMFSSDISSGLLSGGAAGQGRHGVENSPLDPRAPAGYENYYRHTAGSESYEPLLTAMPKPQPDEFFLELVGATPDLKHFVVGSEASLSPGVSEEPGVRRLYEWGAGQFQLLTVLPNGTPDNGEVLHVGSGLPDQRSVSNDGSRVLWTDGAGGSSSLYVREGIGTAQARTVQLDAARGGPESGGGKFLTASSDGAKVFFADHNQITATEVGGEGLGDLYEFKLESGNPEGGQLVNLTPSVGGAGVLGVLGEGASQTGGTYVYFVASGVLASGASAGNDNLYVLHEDPATHAWTPAFIARLSGEDNNGVETNSPGVAIDWSFDAALRTARVTPDGRHVVFMSNNSLTGYDNTVASASSCGADTLGNPLSTQCEEVYLYDAGNAAAPLRCVSCNPSGERPTGPSGVPGGTNFSLRLGLYQSRVISEDGSRVFFESDDGLVPQDINGRRDVYEYEGGHVYLLSDGKSDTNASFVDASANGDDVFFITRASLVPQDTDHLIDLYDARSPHVQGELAGFGASSLPAPCGSEGECRSPGSPETPPLGSPSSTTFSGPGNLTPPTPAPPAKPKTPTRAQLLARALKACRKKHDPHKRRACEKQARKRYASKSSRGRR
jgi:hypothetical protein